ncbi:hypothetical protein M2459_000443 [Parabacteroides sp. PF5-5]|uniref:helix-turn-helix domain-containing protein n=1 Tax=unclassified Parabacteroides TaxID=2649774 RepID=UPI002474839E|nr:MULTISPECIES: helix-turn-helix domain-containing protein [unclassified Parabacteroides]MDH6303623.1 hypothetical protein [Parabacteroides sp. PH5-39]MDH6314945.1 hypothetical protein [Parabacteroides sp. PF5-13]MDH6318282.1 hypothetical protein [Parabacteroides sp. PH5-13]MDH6321785.1 hypothetical protein [Parabacteroides sp. PH5-8]MDH6325909.1 hypothetical protein [Parabacteroides sp. PH5-41]
MKEIYIHDTFIEVLKTKIPKKTKLADFVANILCVEKETAYRRLRGDVQFSLKEAALLASALNLSLDQILLDAQPNTKNRMLVYLPDYSYMRENNSSHIISSINYLQKLIKEPYSEFGVALSGIPFTLYLPYSTLSKFYILKCNYHERICQANTPFKEICETKAQLEHKDELFLLLRQIKKTCYIWDRKIMNTLVNDIHYFKSIHLIEDSEIKSIKEDLNQFLDDLEQLAINGKYQETENKFELYISDIHIDVTYAYLHSERMNMGLLSTFIFYMMTFKQEAIIDNLTNWVKSLKRCSTLISGTGERERILFFDQQRAIVDNL